MAERVSTLTLQLIDDISKPARSVEQAMADAEAKIKAAASAMGEDAGATDRLVGSLAKLEASKADIEAVSRAWKDYAASQNLARDAGDWTSAEATAVRGWETSTIASVRAVIRERDKETDRMRKAFSDQKEAMTKAAAEQKAIREKWFSGAATGVGGMVVAGGLIRSTEDIIKAAADLTQERLNIKELSRKDASEPPFAEQLSADTAAKYPNLTQAEVLRIYTDLRNNAVQRNGMVDKDKMKNLLSETAKAKTAALALGIDFTPQDAQNLLKSVEAAGMANDPNAVRKMFDAYLRLKQVSGNAIDTEKVLTSVQNAKSVNFTAGDEQFFWQNLVRATEGNAARLGNEEAQTLLSIAGGHVTKGTARWLEQMGLISGYTGTGGPAAVISGLKGKDLLQVDQMAWANGPLLDALKAHGVLDEEKVQARMALVKKESPDLDDRTLRERAEHGLIAGALQDAGWRATVADNLAHLIGNELLIQRDIAAGKNARGSEAAQDIAQSPAGAWAEFTQSVANFAAVLGAPSMKPALAALDALAHEISSLVATLATFQAQHPAAAKATSIGAIGATAVGGGALGLAAFGGLAGGLGLKSLGGALTASAATLAKALVRTSVASAAALAAEEVLELADPQGNLWGLTSPIDKWVKGHLGFDPSGGGTGASAAPYIPTRPGGRTTGPADKSEWETEGRAKWQSEGKVSVDTSSLTAATNEAHEAAAAVAALNVTATPQVNSVSLSDTLQVALRLRDVLQDINGAALRAAASIPTTSVTGLHPTLRSNFTASGVHGE
jgi:hypothetical protein